MKRSVGFVLLVSALALLVLTGCAEKEETTAEDVKKETKEAVKTAQAYTEEQRAKYMAEMMDTLESYEEQIKELEMQARDMGDEARMAVEERLQTLREKRDNMSERLDEMRSASGDAWMEMKKGMDKAMDEMSKAYEKAAAEFE
jgi:hypothetical protein